MNYVFKYCFIILFPNFLFSQKEYQNVDTSLAILSKAKFDKGNARVLIFVSPECPLCQAYSLTLNKLHNEYQSKGIYLFSIISGTTFSTQEIENYKNTYGVSMPLLLDENKYLSRKFNATITPQVIIIDSLDAVLYSGRIDNWAYALGKKRKNITEHSLKDAIEDIVNLRPIKIKTTKPIGCFIE